MKKYMFIVTMLVTLQLHAQITGVSLQASGLTCSMCSNAIRKSLLSIDYISEVKSNIRQSTFELKFKSGAAIDFDQIKNKVIDAGFFVASFRVHALMDHLNVQNDRHVNRMGYSLHFLNSKNRELNGEQTFTILDKGFVSAKEFKKNHSLTNNTCYDTGIAGTYCTSDWVPAGKRVIHITL